MPKSVAVYSTACDAITANPSTPRSGYSIHHVARDRDEADRPALLDLELLAAGLRQVRVRLPHLALDLPHHLFGLVGATVREQPARALRDHVADEEDPDREHRAEREG